MSIEAIKSVECMRCRADGAPLTIQEKCLLLLLACDHDREAPAARVSVAVLADRACISERHARRILASLEKHGLIDRSPVLLALHGGRTVNDYRIHAAAGARP